MAVVGVARRDNMESVSLPDNLIRDCLCRSSNDDLTSRENMASLW